MDLGMLEYDHVLKEDPPEAPPANASKEVKDKYVQWHRHNKLALLCMKKYMADSVKGGIPNSEHAKVFFNSIVEKYKISGKAETGNLMNSLVKMKYKGGSIREFILKGSDIAGKLKNLNMNIEDSFLVHLLLNALPDDYGHLKTLYNTQKQNWSINELISFCVQVEDELIKKGKAVDINYMSKPKFKKNFRNKKFQRSAGASSSKTPVKSDGNKNKQFKPQGPVKCFFCKRSGHFKKDCEGFKNWLNKKGIIKDQNPKQE